MNKYKYSRNVTNCISDFYFCNRIKIIDFFNKSHMPKKVSNYSILYNIRNIPSCAKMYNSELRYCANNINRTGLSSYMYSTTTEKYRENMKMSMFGNV